MPKMAETKVRCTTVRTVNKHVNPKLDFYMLDFDILCAVVTKSCCVLDPFASGIIGVLP